MTDIYRGFHFEITEGPTAFHWRITLNDIRMGDGLAQSRSNAEKAAQDEIDRLKKAARR